RSTRDWSSYVALPIFPHSLLAAVWPVFPGHRLARRARRLYQRRFRHPVSMAVHGPALGTLRPIKVSDIAFEFPDPRKSRAIQTRSEERHVGKHVRKGR